jgi:hypothetical protein
MTKTVRNPQKDRSATKEMPEEYASEPAMVPSATAVAAEALATGVVPLESQSRHSEDRPIPDDADFVGDETIGGDNPTPDENQVDDVGRAMGVQEEDSGALRSSAEILDRRDRHRGQLEAPEPRRGTRQG